MGNFDPSNEQIWGSSPVFYNFPLGKARQLIIGKIVTLPNLDNITIRITHITTGLAGFGDRRRDELGPRLFQSS